MDCSVRWQLLDIYVLSYLWGKKKSASFLRITCHMSSLGVCWNSNLRQGSALVPPLTHPFNTVTLGTCGSDGEAFDFVCLWTFCAFEFGHLSAETLEEFLLLQSRDTGLDQRIKYPGEAKVGPGLLKGRHSSSPVQVYRRTWHKLVK